MILPLLAALMAPVPAEPVSAEPVPLPAWLSGSWSSAEGEGWMDETWTTARGGTMFGAARIGTGDKVEFWETMRIERKADGALAFIAQPRGAPGAEFPLVAQGERMAEFANAAHDYPQRIRYWREGGRLLAEISLLDGSKPERFSYRLESD